MNVCGVMLFGKIDMNRIERLELLTQELDEIKFSEVLCEILCRLDVIEREIGIKE